MSANALTVSGDLSIPRSELSIRATRSGGPGGQHVNTSSTRIELWWNPARSRALSDSQRSRLLDTLASRLDAEGNLRIVASAFRSQARNREDAEHRLATVLRRSLQVPKARRPTRPPRRAVESRLSGKRRQAEKKRERGARDFD